MDKILGAEEKAALLKHAEQATTLSRRLLTCHKKICDEQIKHGSKQEVSKLTAKTFLLSSGQLGGQVIIVTSKRCLFLGMIGLRTMAEYYIYAKYIYNHPKHVGDMTWIDKASKDFDNRSFDEKAIKNRLDNKTLVDRAKEVGQIDVYQDVFERLCAYAHPTHLPVRINQKDFFTPVTFEVLHLALCFSYDIGEDVCVGLNLEKDTALELDIALFRDSCSKHAKLRKSGDGPQGATP